MAYIGPGKPTLLAMILHYNDQYPTDIIKLKISPTLTEADIAAARKLLNDRLATRTKYLYNDLQLQAKKLQGFCNEILDLTGFKSYVDFRWMELSVCMRDMRSAIEGKWGETYEKFEELKRAEKEKQDKDRAKVEREKGMKAEADWVAKVEQQKMAEEKQKKLDQKRKQQELKDMEEQRKLDQQSRSKLQCPRADQRRHTTPQMMRAKKSIETLGKQAGSPAPPSPQLLQQKKSLEDLRKLAASPAPSPQHAAPPQPRAMTPRPKKNIESLFMKTASPNAPPALPPRQKPSAENLKKLAKFPCSQIQGDLAQSVDKLRKQTVSPSSHVTGDLARRKKSTEDLREQNSTGFSPDNLREMEKQGLVLVPIAILKRENATPPPPPRQRKSVEDLREQSLAAVPDALALQIQKEGVGRLRQIATTTPTNTPSAVEPLPKKSTQTLRQTAALVAPQPMSTPPPSLPARKKSTENSKQATIASIPAQQPITSPPILQAKNKSTQNLKQTTAPLPPPTTPPPAIQKLKRNITNSKKVAFVDIESADFQEPEGIYRLGTQMPGKWKDEADIAPARKKGRGVEYHEPKMEKAHYEALRLASEIGKFSWPPMLEK